MRIAEEIGLIPKQPPHRYVQLFQIACLYNQVGHFVFIITYCV